MPGPPPNGASSTERWRSSVNSRRSCTRMSTRAPSRARFTIPSARVPSTRPGKMVRMSIRIDQLRRTPHQHTTSEVHLFDERFCQRDQDLPAGLSPHDEHGRLAAGLPDALHDPQRTAVLVADPEPDELVVVVGAGGEGRDLVLGYAELEAAVALGRRDAVDAFELQDEAALVGPARCDLHLARSSARSANVRAEQGLDALRAVRERLDQHLALAALWFHHAADRHHRSEERRVGKEWRAEVAGAQ